MTRYRNAAERIGMLSLIGVALIFFRFANVQEFHLTKAFAANLFALVAWGLIILDSRQGSSRSIRVSFASLAVLGTAAWMFVSVAWSESPQRWYEAVVASAGPLALYFFWLPRDDEAGPSLTPWVSAAAALVAAAGLLQWAGVLPGNLDAYGAVDPGSTLGLSNFAGEFLMPWIAVPFVSAARTKVAARRWGYAAAGALPLLFILAAGSRASQLGLFAATLVALALFTNRHALRAVLLVAVLAGFVAMGAWGMRAVSDGSVRMRFVTWKQTLALVADHPVLGIGFGNYATVFRRYPDPWFDEASTRQKITVDHPHNAMLEMIAEGGAVQAALLVLLALGIAMLLRRLMRVDRMLGAALAGGMVGFAVAASFGFPQSLAAPMLVFFAALASLERPAKDGLFRLPESGVALALGAVCLVATFGSANLAVGEISYQFAARASNPQDQVEWLDTALVANPFHVEALIKRSNASLREGRTEDAAGYLLRATEVASADPRILKQLGIFAAQAGDYESALGLVRQAYQYNPSQHAVYVPLISSLHLELRQPEAAISFVQGSLDAGQQEPEIFAALADAQLRNENSAAAQMALNEGLLKHPDSLVLKLLVPRVRFAMGDFSSAGERLNELRSERLTAVQSGQLDVIEAKLALRADRVAALEKIEAMVERNPATLNLMRVDPELRKLLPK